MEKANKAIKEYETSIEQFQKCATTKNAELVERVKEVAELKASLVKESAARETLQQTMNDEVSKVQSQLEVVL